MLIRTLFLFHHQFWVQKTSRWIQRSSILLDLKMEMRQHMRVGGIARFPRFSDLCSQRYPVPFFHRDLREMRIDRLQAIGVKNLDISSVTFVKTGRSHATAFRRKNVASHRYPKIHPFVQAATVPGGTEVTLAVFIIPQRYGVPCHWNGADEKGFFLPILTLFIDKHAGK